MSVHPLWFICLLARFLLAVAVYQANPFWNQYLSFILILIGAGFFYKGYFSSNDEMQIAKVFWHETRYIHGLFYLKSGFYLYHDNKNMASILILSDICFSVLYRIIQNK